MRVALGVALLLLTACHDDGGSGVHLRRPSGSTQETLPAPADGGSPILGPPGDAAAPPIDPWATAVPYTLITPPDESTDHHLGEAHVGDDCMSCHTGAGAPRFVLAGTVFSNKTGLARASGVQVRVVGPTGDEVAIVGTDASGNFWLGGIPDLTPGSLVGVRDATSKRTMGAAIAGVAACNGSGCHTSARPIHLDE